MRPGPTWRSGSQQATEDPIWVWSWWETTPPVTPTSWIRPERQLTSVRGTKKISQSLTLICVNTLVLRCINVSHLQQQTLCCCCFLVICFFKKSFHTWTSHRNIERNHPQALRHQWGGVVGFDRQTQHRPSCRRPAGSAAFARWRETRTARKNSKNSVSVDWLTFGAVAVH